MHKLLFTALSGILLLCGCNKSEEADFSLPLTPANLSGTWIAESYSQDGTVIPQDELRNDYIHFSDDRLFTARFDLLEEDGFYTFGHVLFREDSIIAAAVGNEHVFYYEVQQLTENRLVLSKSGGLKQSFRKTGTGGLYCLENRAETTKDFLMFVSSFPVLHDNHIPYVNYHSRLFYQWETYYPNYTPYPESIYLLITVMENVQTRPRSFITAYPQYISDRRLLTPVVVHDTTSVYEVFSHRADLSKANRTDNVLPLKEFLTNSAPQSF